MPVFIFIFFIFLLAYCVLIDYYRRTWNNIPGFSSARDKQLSPPFISLIIPLRNEEIHVERLINELLSQQYPDEQLEIILVDDHSTDATFQLLSKFSDAHKHIRILQLPDEKSGKKKAIEQGIKSCGGQLIVTTDADCSFSPAWLVSIAECYQVTAAKFIAAPVKMVSSRSILGIFQSLDFITMQGITGASVHKKIHAMCNGANLAYERRVFFEVDGFNGIDNIPSGDDMLLMQKIFSAYPNDVHYLKSQVAIVTTPAEKTWKQFFHQRIRWASKAVHYKSKKIFFVLLLTWVVNLCFVVLFFATLMNSSWFWILCLLLLLKILVEFPFVNAVARFFKSQQLMKYFPFLQPIHILYVIVSGWLGRFGSYEWKSRIIKNNGVAKRPKQ